MKPLEVASVIQVVFNLSQPTVHQIKVLVILTERKCRKLLAHYWLRMGSNKSIFSLSDTARAA